MSFLTAEWRKLALANYACDPQVLQDLVPPHTELDLWNDTCYVSLVGFMFINTRVLGIKVPGHVNFEEVNLRFYVRHHDGQQWKRGVVFVSELVPKPAIAWVANTLYREHYGACPMRHRFSVEVKQLKIRYEWKRRARWHHFEVEAENKPQPLVAGSEAEFITEHYWGYTPAGPHKTYEYGVTHPRWETYPVQDYSIEADFEALYGSRFAFLNQAQPLSVMLAEGSGITVEKRGKLK